jgi:hypothetical protein
VIYPLRKTKQYISSNHRYKQGKALILLKGMSGTVKVSYNINNIKHNVSWGIKNIIFKWNGIIFGGFVRDSIISQHYSQLFWEKYNYSNKHFWNEQFDPNTAPRTLIPNDIDVCIYNEQHISDMMNEITLLFNKEFGAANIKQAHRVVFKNIQDIKGYIDAPIGNLHTFIYTITVGMVPYFSDGTTFNIMFDIIAMDKKHIKPPFNKLDFLCNGFIMTDHNDIALSNFTGTEIDKLKLVEKKEIESKIIKDIILFKTDYCLRFKDIAKTNIYASIRDNDQACRRVEKMCNKKYPWTIENMPIIIVNPKKQIGDGACGTGAKICCICYDGIKNKERSVAFPLFDSNNNMIQGTPMHTYCFFKYMFSQIQDKKKDYENNSYNNDNLELEDCRTFLRCPMRNNINFNADNIVSVIDKYLGKDSPFYQKHTA